MGGAIVAIPVEREYGFGGSPFVLCRLAVLFAIRGRDASESDLCSLRPFACAFRSSRTTGFHLSTSRS